MTWHDMTWCDIIWHDMMLQYAPGSAGNGFCPPSFDRMPGWSKPSVSSTDSAVDWRQSRYASTSTLCYELYEYSANIQINSVYLCVWIALCTPLISFWPKLIRGQCASTKRWSQKHPCNWHVSFKRKCHWAVKSTSLCLGSLEQLGLPDLVKHPWFHDTSRCTTTNAGFSALQWIQYDTMNPAQCKQPKAQVVWALNRISENLGLWKRPCESVRQQQII